MAAQTINSKFITFATKALFENTDKFEVPGNSVVFISDTGEIYCKGKRYVGLVNSSEFGMVPKCNETDTLLGSTDYILTYNKSPQWKKSTNIVRTNDDQTISGTKTFTSDLYLDGDRIFTHYIDNENKTQQREVLAFTDSYIELGKGYRTFKPLWLNGSKICMNIGENGKFSIDSSGHVGIGTHTPSGSYMLQVAGGGMVADKVVSWVSGFVKHGCNDNSVLLAGGGHKSLSDFKIANVPAYYSLVSQTDPYSLIKETAMSFEKNKLIHASLQCSYLDDTSYISMVGWMSSRTSDLNGWFLSNSDGNNFQLYGVHDNVWTNDTLLHSGNSYVSGGGSSGSSSITVTLGPTSATLTIPSKLPADGGTADTIKLFKKGLKPDAIFAEEKLIYCQLNSTNSGKEGYAGDTSGFPVANNANGIIWTGVHSGQYGGQLGISSNGYLYYRYITNKSFPTTANGGSWNRIAWVSEIPTKLPATKLDTAVKIYGNTFDGTTDIEAYLYGIKNICGSTDVNSSLLSINGTSGYDLGKGYYDYQSWIWGKEFKFVGKKGNDNDYVFMMIGNNGNVGIGDVAGAPAEKLHVAGGNVIANGYKKYPENTYSTPYALLADGTARAITSEVTSGSSALITSGAIYSQIGNLWKKGKYTVDLETPIVENNITKTFDSTKFYPVIFTTSQSETDCEIYSPSGMSSMAYNQNFIHFLFKRAGWTDSPQQFKILSYGVYSTEEITIGAIGGGTTSGDQCVWLRGGRKYTVYCNKVPTLYYNGYTSNMTNTNEREIYTVGTNYHGGTNTRVTIVWSALQTARQIVTKEETYDAKLDRTKNYVLAAPNGSDGPASFRALTLADLPHTHSYLPLDGGTMNYNANIKFNHGAAIFTTATTSNAIKSIVWYKGSTQDSSKNNPATFGWHNIGGSGTGAAYIVPYPHDADPWGGTVGLYISETSLKFEGYTILNSSNYLDYTVSKTGSRATGTWDISISGNAATVSTIQTATTTAVGGIKVKSVNTNAISTNANGSNYYGVNIDKNGNAYVAIPSFESNIITTSDFVKFYLSPMESGAPAESAKNWFINTMPSSSGAIVYNVPGLEKTIIAGKSSNYGHMLQLNYSDTYLRILRYEAGSWKSTDWEKISAGYADSAGSVAWGNVTGKPSTFTPTSHTHSYLTAYGEGNLAATRTADYTTALCTGGWASSSAGYGSTWGTTLDVSGYSTWYHRLAFRTDGRIEYWQGINTKTLNKIGDIALTSDIPEAARSLLGRTTEGVDYDVVDGNLIFAEWNTYNDNRWYLKAKGYETRVNYATSAGNADTVDSKHASDFKYVNLSNYSYTPNLAFYDGGSASTNYYKLSVTNVNNVWTMLYVEMSIKENYSSNYYGKIMIHLNKNNSNDISGFTVHTLGQLSSSVKAYANNNSSSLDIYIAGNWSWPTLNVDRVTFGDTAASTTGKNITLTKVTALPSSYITASIKTGIHSGNISSYAVNSITIIADTGIEVYDGSGNRTSSAITSSGTRKLRLSIANSSDIGGIKLGYTVSDYNYPVVLDSSYAAYVNVPVFTKSGSTSRPGLVPTPSKTAGTTKYLREDGTWTTPPNSNTWNANALNVAGYVAAPTSSTAEYVWKTDSNGNPSWQIDYSRGLRCKDTRDSVIATTELSAGATFLLDFKKSAVSGLSAAYSGIISFRPYASGSDWTGGPAHQLAFDVNGIHHRTGDGNGWGSWKKLINSSTIMGGATASKSGTAGLVPAPPANAQTKFLRGDGSWATVSSQSSTFTGDAETVGGYTIIVTDTLPNVVGASDIVFII